MGTATQTICWRNCRPGCTAISRRILSTRATSSEHLGVIKAKSYVMPCEKDLYFRRADSAAELERMPNAELRTLDSP